MTLYCHNCKAAISYNYRHRRSDGNNYHKNCPTLRVPTGEISTQAVVQIEEERQLYIAALELVLLFLKLSPWSSEKQDSWREMTGVEEVSREVLCKHIRKVLG